MHNIKYSLGYMCARLQPLCEVQPRPSNLTADKPNPVWVLGEDELDAVVTGDDWFEAHWLCPAPAVHSHVTQGV